MTFSVHAKHPLPINLVVSTRLAVYNSKSSKPNGSASPFRKKDLTSFKSFQPASSMAQSFACCSPCQNLHDGKDELAGGIPIKDSDRWTPVPAATRAFTPAVALVVTRFIAFGSANSSVVRYLEDDLQQIFRTILDSRSPAPVSAPVVAVAPYYKSPYERPLKT